ncbi:MAG: SURF1 family protein [Betaproteobacteria bacterium]|nr:SURF1 family protein [Betaproteobacteria bacterium]
MPVRWHKASDRPAKAWRQAVVASAALAGVLSTFNLGLWQLSRAQEKLSLQASLDAQALLPALQTADVLGNPQAWQQIHRRVELKGQWLSDQTTYLDNRTHHGQAGFWVMTPLRWAPGEVVWVQRGWVQRDPVEANKAPLVDTPVGEVVVSGRITTALSHMVELGSSAPVLAQSRPRIQANLDMPTMRALVTDNVNAVVIQTGEPSEGLRRDWPVVASSADKNKGYAFQWFALCALITGLYLWFQWIQPARRHAQSTHEQP